METSVNSFEGATVTHLEAEATSTHFLNQLFFLTVNLYLKNSNGSGRQAFSMK